MSDRPMRAGDSDRSAVLDLLRAHHLDGRLTVEEFEQRVERAHGAVTLLELGELHDDLPELAPRRGKVVGRARRAPRVPGRLAFVERVTLDIDPRRLRDEVFDDLAPPLARNGYALSVAGDALSFRRSWRPGWTIVVAVFFFPFGLIALGHRRHDEVIVQIEERVNGGSALLVHGVAGLTVRRAFADLGASL